MELQGLVEDHVLQDILGRLEVVPRPVKLLRSFDDGLVVFVGVEVRMHKALLDRVALLRVEHQHLAQQLKCRWIRLREDSLERLLVAND